MTRDAPEQRRFPRPQSGAGGAARARGAGHGADHASEAAEDKGVADGEAAEVVEDGCAEEGEEEDEEPRVEPGGDVAEPPEGHVRGRGTLRLHDEEGEDRRPEPLAAAPGPDELQRRRHRREEERHEREEQLRRAVRGEQRQGWRGWRWAAAVVFGGGGSARWRPR